MFLIKEPRGKKAWEKHPWLPPTKQSEINHELAIAKIINSDIMPKSNQK